MTSPTALYPDSVGTFVIFRCGFFVPGVVAWEQVCTAPSGPSSTHALLRKPPLSMSACTIVWVAVQLIDVPGASGDPLAGVQARSVTCSSVTLTNASVVLPSLV